MAVKLETICCEKSRNYCEKSRTGMTSTHMIRIHISKVYIINITKVLENVREWSGGGCTKSQRSEIQGRMMNFLDLDSDGLRRVVLESMVQSQEFTVLSLHEEVSKEVNVSRKVVASMTG